MEKQQKKRFAKTKKNNHIKTHTHHPNKRNGEITCPPSIFLIFFTYILYFSIFYIFLKFLFLVRSFVVVVKWSKKAKKACYIGKKS